MKLHYAKSNWEMSAKPLGAFLERARKDGFDAVEIYMPGLSETPGEISRQVADEGLLLVAQMTTVGATPAEHLDSLESCFAQAVETGPILINSHTARDIFPFAENCRIFERATELSRQAGIPFTNETHRSRPTSSGPQTRRYLEAIPDMRINADFSHWVCVHESDLSDQPENVEAAIARSSHVHARVGFNEGPQVPDPLDPQWSEWTELHIGWWRQIISAREAAGAEFLVIVPEFGPPPYMPVEPGTGRPLADAWEINCRFKDHLKSIL